MIDLRWNASMRLLAGATYLLKLLVKQGTLRNTGTAKFRNTETEKFLIWYKFLNHLSGGGVIRRIIVMLQVDRRTWRPVRRRTHGNGSSQKVL